MTEGYSTPQSMQGVGGGQTRIGTPKGACKGAWPAEKGIAGFSHVVGNPVGRFLIRRYNAFARWMIPAGINRTLTPPELAAYTGPFPTPDSRLPTWIFAHQILASRDYLAEVEAGLAMLRDKPALVVWGEKDGAFGEPERLRLMRHFANPVVRLLPEAKHFIQENALDAICTAIEEASAPVASQTAHPA